MYSSVPPVLITGERLQSVDMITRCDIYHGFGLSKMSFSREIQDLTLVIQRNVFVYTPSDDGYHRILSLYDVMFRLRERQSFQELPFNLLRHCGAAGADDACGKREKS
jgi:hypothetical protein